MKLVFCSKDLERQRLQNSYLEAENARLIALLQENNIPFTKQDSDE